LPNEEKGKAYMERLGDSESVRAKSVLAMGYVRGPNSVADASCGASP